MSQTRDKSSGAGNGGDRPRKVRRKRKRRASDVEPIDVRTVLEEPIRVRHGDTTKPMHPYEVILRQNLKQSIHEQSLRSIKYALKEAEKHGLIKRPPPAAKGGVFIFPKNLPPEIEKRAWDSIDENNGSMAACIRILYEYGGIELIKRCFNVK